MALPTLDLYVTGGCRVCQRTRQALSRCKRLHELVQVVEHDLGDVRTVRPIGVVGGPTLVFNGAVVGLGTPDCSELADRIEAILASETTEAAR